MKKKLLSLFMACAMILALAVPAFAVDYYGYADTASEDLSQPITFEARTFVPTVKLYLPTQTGDSLVLNPYKIEYSGEGNALNGQDIGDTTTGGSNDKVKQVISPVYAIKNETDVKLNFAVSATATVEGSVSLVGDYVPLGDTAKKAHLTVVIAKRSTTTAPSFATTSNQYLDGSNTVANETITLKSTGEAKTGADIKYLDAVARAATPTPNYLYFQFQGDLTRKPTVGWTADDKVTAVLTFTFTPESQADFTATKDDSTNTIPATPADKTYTLPKNGVTSPAITVTGLTINATTPDWSVVSSPFANTTIASDALKIPKEALGDVPTTATDYIIVLGCKDVNGVPRTVQLTLKLAHA